MELGYISSNEMKKLLAPLYSSIPFLVEYISSETEEKEIDSMQARKCCDFKRMLLESLKDGDGVGIPVPIGYDDIQVLIHDPYFISTLIVLLSHRTLKVGLYYNHLLWTKFTAPQDFSQPDTMWQMSLNIWM
jgi:hypothetical protein